MNPRYWITMKIKLLQLLVFVSVWTFINCQPGSAHCIKKRPLADNPKKYQMQVAGWGWMTLPCPPGTTYNIDSCECLSQHLGSPTLPKCPKELFLTFNRDAQDESGKRHRVYNENVVIDKGFARFSGQNSRLRIPTLKNINKQTLVIIVKYYSNHNISGNAMSIVSNGNCGNIPSIMIAEDSKNVYFGVGTETTIFNYTFVEQLNTSGLKSIKYTFENGYISGQRTAFGSEPIFALASGSISNVNCDLTIGNSNNHSPFVGDIEEISMYFCNPKST